MKELSMHILDIGQNSIVANAKLIQIIINEDIFNNELTIIIEDDGQGMSQEELKKVVDPFYTTRSTRRIGLGIPMFKASAEACNGEFHIHSLKGKGTKVKAVFQYNHIDRAPLGNMVDTIIALILSNISVDFLYIHSLNNIDYVFDTRLVKDILGEIPLSNIEVIEWIKKEIKSGLDNLKQGNNINTGK